MGPSWLGRRVAVAQPVGVSTPAAGPDSSERTLSGKRVWLVDRPGLVAGSALLWVVLGALLILPMAVFLVQAFSPRLFGAGDRWFTLSNFESAFSRATLRGLADSVGVSAATSVICVAIGGSLAWGVHRTDLPGRRLWPILMWALLLVPTFLAAEGWEYLLQPQGVLSQFGIDASPFYGVFFGPVGVVFVLAMSALPYAYITISAALLHLGSEFEEAARVHGAGVWRTTRIMLPILGPALLSAAAIVFAESMSDFGVASTLAANAHFPVATYVLFQAIDNNPADFGLAAAIGWLLVASAAIPIAVQAWALRGRTYAVVSGRTRTATRTHLSPVVRVAATGSATLLFGLALGAPVVGALVASLLKGFGSEVSVSSLTLDSYRSVLAGNADLAAPLAFSTAMAAVTALATMILGLAVARLLSARGAGRLARLTDLVLLGSVALPGIVLAAGYIFAYNLPLLGNVGLDLYETTPLLIMGYVATALPSQARLMSGPVSQLQDSLVQAARVHGSSAASAWRKALLPVLSRILLWAGLLTFAKTLLELPVSQLLYPPGSPPVSVAINSYVAGYHYDTGTAMTVVALAEEFAVILAGLALFALLTPKGWRRSLGATP